MRDEAWARWGDRGATGHMPCNTDQLFNFIEINSKCGKEYAELSGPVVAGWES
jgi:hypothetical protein